MSSNLLIGPTTTLLVGLPSWDDSGTWDDSGSWSEGGSTLLIGGESEISLDVTGSLVLAGYDAVYAEVIASLPTGSLELAGYPANYQQFFDLPTGSLDLSGYASFLHPTFLLPTGSLELSGSTPKLTRCVFTDFETYDLLESFETELQCTDVSYISGGLYDSVVPTNYVSATKAAYFRSLTFTTPATEDGELSFWARTQSGADFTLLVKINGVTVDSFTVNSTFQEKTYSLPSGTNEVTIVSESLTSSVRIDDVTICGLTGDFPLPLGSLELTGYDAENFLEPYRLRATGSLELNGYGFEWVRSWTFPVGSLQIAGYDASPYSFGGTAEFSLPTGSLQVASPAARWYNGRIELFATGSLELTGYAVRVDNAIVLPVGSLELNGKTPFFHETIQLPTGSLELSSSEPRYYRGRLDLGATGSLRLSSPAATFFTGNISLEETGSLELTGFAPEFGNFSFIRMVIGQVIRVDASANGYDAVLLPPLAPPESGVWGATLESECFPGRRVIFDNEGRGVGPDWASHQLGTIDDSIIFYLAGGRIKVLSKHVVV